MINPLAKKALHTCLDDSRDLITMLGAMTRAMEIFGSKQEKQVAALIDLVILMGADLAAERLNQRGEPVQ
jgi:hypothetical protein